MQNLDNYFNYVAYAAGFATGNFVGMMIEEKLAMGIQMIRVFTHEKGPELLQILNSNGYGATIVEAEGARGKVHLIYTIVERHELNKVIDVIYNFNPKVFYTVEDIKATREGIFSHSKHKTIFQFSNVLRDWRKGK